MLIPEATIYLVQNGVTNADLWRYLTFWYKLHQDSCTNHHTSAQFPTIQEKNTVLLFQREFDKWLQTNHHRFRHNPFFIYFPRASYNIHGWTEGLESTSNQDMDILYFHAWHLEDKKPYRTYSPFEPFSIECLGWTIWFHPNLELIHLR